MKKRLTITLALFALVAGFGFSNPRLELDLGADFSVFPKCVENFYPAFKYDVQLGIPIYSEMEIFIKGGQSFMKEKSEKSNVLVSRVLAGFDYHFLFGPNDFFRPAFAVGAISLMEDGSSETLMGIILDVKLYYDHNLSEHFQLNLGVGMSLMFYKHESPIDTYSPLDVTAGVSYRL